MGLIGGRKINGKEYRKEPSSTGLFNIEDVAAPECFEVENRLREMLDIPVFHDDQHGTAIISFAGLINYLLLTGKKIEEIKIVINGGGAAGIRMTGAGYHFLAIVILGHLK